jgi:hypothetical protein
MNQSSINKLADFATKFGEVVADLVIKQPECISTQAFVDLIEVAMRFSRAMQTDQEFCRRPSYRQFEIARQIAMRCLQEEQGS